MHDVLGFFRLKELLPKTAGAYSLSLSLLWGDITVDSQENPRTVKIHLRKSKCKQFGSGADIILGRTHTALCPVAAVLSYIVVCPMDPGPLFLRTEGRMITKAWYVGEIRSILAGLGLPQHQYAGHSFCIGAATSAALAGIKDLMIQTLGRWQSAAFLQYIQDAKGTSGSDSILCDSSTTSSYRLVMSAH